MQRMRGTTKRSVKNDIKMGREYLRIIEKALDTTAPDYERIGEALLEMEGHLSGLRSEIEHQTHDEFDYACPLCYDERNAD